MKTPMKSPGVLLLVVLEVQCGEEGGTPNER